MEKIKLIVVQGLPASGKTTWSREWVNKDPKNRVRVNRDDIRNMLGPYWIPQREDLVTDIETMVITEGLMQGYSVVADSTNLRGTQRFEHIIIDAEDKAFKINQDDINIGLEVKDLTDVPVETCIERDAQREEGQVGEEVILNMAKKYNLL